MIFLLLIMSAVSHGHQCFLDGKIRYHVSGQRYPFQYFTEDWTATGLGVDVARAVAEEMELEPVFIKYTDVSKLVDHDGAYDKLAAYDFSIGYDATQLMRAAVDFTVPISHSPIAKVWLDKKTQAEGLNQPNLVKKRMCNNCDGKACRIVSTTQWPHFFLREFDGRQLTPLELLDQQCPGAARLGYSSWPLALDDLEQEEGIDGLWSDTWTMSRYLHLHPDLLATNTDYVLGDGTGLIAVKGSSCVSMWNAAFLKLKASGKIAELCSAYPAINCF
eukprot:NODE_3663_length_923_cov_45.614322_g3511_i0.p1 GENE.NODE_3663_length_923_cov_45.614322_g3511_i0~~NODE_3663_length_923_cov_45.614322_g3511_i0.p1  ORF type:complete len:289 (+),score=37.91 NODE_3663_length_923_cov_45.614322_g3511_i0:43-867(+)